MTVVAINMAAELREPFLYNAGLSIELLLKAACLHSGVPIKKIVAKGHNLVRLAEEIGFLETEEHQRKYYDILLALYKFITHFAKYPIGKREEDFDEGYKFYEAFDFHRTRLLDASKIVHPVHNINWESYSHLREKIYFFVRT